jgi:hypothetical protein
MRDHLERELVKFEVGPTLPLEQWSQKLFERYRTIRGAVSRYLATEAEDRAARFDRGLHPREWQQGDKVFRKESRGVASKFIPRNAGPYRVAQVLSSHKVVLDKMDGEAAFSYPVPIAELIYVPERRGAPSVDFEKSGSRSLGGMLQNKDDGEAPIPGSRAKFAKLGPGAYVVYKAPVAGTPKSIIVGRLVENMVHEGAMKLRRYVGVWGQTRVKWTVSEQDDIVRYQQVVREVSLHRDGATSYSDLRALENGRYELQASQELIAVCDEILPWLLSVEATVPIQDQRQQDGVEGASSRHASTPVEAMGGYLNRKDQVYVCQPDGLVVSDSGALAHIEKPTSVRSERRWLAAVRACGAKLNDTLGIVSPGAVVKFDAGERQVSAFQRALKGISIVDVACFVPPESTPLLDLPMWIAKAVDSCSHAVLAVYTAGSVAVYSMRTWEEMGGLCKELPYGEYYVVLGCKPARGATEFSYAAQTGPPAFSGTQSGSVDVPEQDGVPHVKRWDGDPRPSVLVSDEWRAKAKDGKFAEVRIPMECYVGAPAVCPRSNAEYAEACVKDLMFPPGDISTVTAEHRATYPDLLDIELVAAADMIRRKAAVMWREDTPQTTVAGFLHDLVVKGGPISLPPICRRGEAADWVEEKIRKDYARGQLMPGNSAWGSPAFRVSAKGRKDRMVVDYRRLNSLTERATFLMPSAEGVKTRVAGSKWFSTADSASTRSRTPPLLRKS